MAICSILKIRQYHIRKLRRQFMVVDVPHIIPMAGYYDMRERLILFLINSGMIHSDQFKLKLENEK